METSFWEVIRIAADFIQAICYLTVLPALFIKRWRLFLTPQGFITFLLATSGAFIFVATWFYAGFHQTYEAFSKPAKLLADAMTETPH